MYIYIIIRLSECISSPLERIHFHLCRYLENFGFNVCSTSILVAQHIKIDLEKYEHFKLQSNFSVMFENIDKHKVK